MNHLPQAAEVLAAKLADLRGISREEAVIAALKEALEGTTKKGLGERKPENEDAIRRIDSITTRYRARPLLDDRPPEDLLGFDDFGLPR